MGEKQTRATLWRRSWGQEVGGASEKIRVCVNVNLAHLACPFTGRLPVGYALADSQVGYQVGYKTQIPRSVTRLPGWVAGRLLAANFKIGERNKTVYDRAPL